MIRKLSLAVAVAAALSPLGLFALGLGEIHTHSALNQEFKADIDLLSVSEEELQDVRVTLASQEAFTTAGIDRPFLLSSLKFTPSLTADGRPVITVTSRDPIREPFLNFLIEVNWPKGRLLREYTVLLDPPVTLERTPAPVQAPKVATSAARELAPVTRPEARPVVESTPNAVATSAGERVYGPVQANENLWSIAQSLRQEGETIEQVMLALLRYNPDAFIKNNVNLLKTGKILRLPEEADVTSLSRSEARQEFLAQTREWRQQQQQTSSVNAITQDVPAETLDPQQQAQIDRLELVAAKLDEGEESLDQEGMAERTEQVARLEKALLIAKEENASARLENRTLQSRVVELEAQLKDMQRLLTLQNDQMTELQTAQRLIEQTSETLESVQQQPLVEPLPIQPAEPKPDIADNITSDAEFEPTTLSSGTVFEPRPGISGEDIIQQVDIEQVISEAIQAEQATSSQVIAAQPAVSEAVDLAPATDPAASLANAPAATATIPVQEPSEVGKVDTSVQPPASKPVESKSFLDNLLANTMLMSLGGGVVLILLILLGLIIHRRKQVEAEFAESILVTSDAEAAGTANRSTVGAVNETSEETSFMSDFSPSDIDALQDETGEVDPISEADVYIAYGRYQQAEELIKQAIERFPEREELKHKLLEIYYSAKDDSKFTSLAQELQQAGLENQQPDLWAKIVAMGKELNPSSPLLGGAAGLMAGLGLGEDDNELDDLGLNLDSSLSDDFIQPPSTGLAEPAAKSAEAVTSVDLSSLDKLEQDDSEHPNEALAMDSEFLNSLEEPKADSMAGKQSDILDMNLDGLDNPVEHTPPAGHEEPALASSLDSLSELSEFEIEDADSNAIATADDNVVGLERSESLEDLDLKSLEKELELLSGDLHENQADVPADQHSEAEAEGLGLTDELAMSNQQQDPSTTDEVMTKLYLAREYADMGDAEGAKSILEEVVTEGSDDQKQQAREILQALNA